MLLALVLSCYTSPNTVAGLPSPFLLRTSAGPLGSKAGQLCEVLKLPCMCYDLPS